MSTLGSSFPGTSGSVSQEATEGCASLISNRKLKVTLLSFEWGSTKGGLSTINRELAIQLAKNDNVEVTMYLPLCSEEDERAAAEFRVHLLKANKKPGCDPIDWLASVPKDHHMDIVIGHGICLGRQVITIKEFRPGCKWIQVVHTDPEELAMFKDDADPIVEGAKKHQAEVELCELADQVVAVGPKLKEAFACYLYSCKKNVINLTPGIFSEFAIINHAAEERETFRIFVFGSGNSKDFLVKGYDIAARAVAMLNDEERLFKLVFVGAPDGEKDKVKERFLEEGILRSQLAVRSGKERDELAKQFYEADLVMMPSRTEGFGLAALEALSAGLPVLVSGNSGIGKALNKVPNGSYCVVNSEKPKKWAKAIRTICSKEKELRLQEAIFLRQSYAETYQWEGQCNILLEKMLEMIKETSTAPDQAVAAVSLGEQGPTGSSVSESVSYPDATTIQHIVDDAVSSGRENAVIQEETPRTHPLTITEGREGMNAGIPERRQDVGSEDFRKYGEKVIKLLIEAKTLEKEKKEFIEEILTRIVQAYDKGSDHSRDWRHLKSFTDTLIETYEVLVLIVDKGSIVVSLRCPTLASLEHLWSDYRSGDLDKLAERYLVTDDMKEKLKLEKSYLKITIDEKNYLNCKKALMELLSTCSENPGKDLLHPSETTTTEKKRQNTDVTETISSNTKKEDAIQNIPDSPLLASETLSNAEESSSHQPKQRCGEEDEAAEALDREICEVMSAGIGEENFSLEAILKQLPSPPSHHPDDTKDGATCSTTASALSTSSVHRATSGGSSLSRDSYTWSISSSDLPLSLSHDEEKLVWPLKETFDIKDNQFEEGVQFDIIAVAGIGAFGHCYVASKRSDSTLFCIKKCQYQVNEVLALYMAKTENIKEIVDYYGAKLKGRNAYICMEYMTGGTISNHVKRRQQRLKAGAWPIIPEDTCFVFLEDILKALKFLNGKGLVHRDIKGDNVLLDEEGTHAKLTDFALAENIQVPGSWSDDIWKTGCLHLEMLNGERSFVFGVMGGGLQRQSSFQPDKHFPSQAKEETIELLNLFFGSNRDYIPSAAEILHVAHVFQCNNIKNQQIFHAITKPD
ncbi:uncharacterized protein [Acropora muricata]|uniref:uncharacterized protein isoform X2 n=1 Tax=Acropora muricata TaxID=159855 RepID=UPI0034E4A8AC